MLWDLLQSHQLRVASDQAASLEERVAFLERQVERNEEVLAEVIKYLEQRDNKDLDGDGSVG